MTYVEIVKESIEYIEKNLKNSLSLEEISSKFYITKYHYSRIFRAVTGFSVIDYYKKRKFSSATYDLKNSEKNILEIAFDYGYNSQEAFSRAYKKYTGYSPKTIKKSSCNIKNFPKFKLLERKFKNYNNTLLTNHKIIEKEENICFGKKLSVSFEKFIQDGSGIRTIENFAKSIPDLNKLFVFTFITTSPNKTLDLGMYILKDEKYKIKNRSEILEKIIIPKGKYMKIEYKGSMQESWKNVTEDIKMICKHKNLKRNQNFINFYQEFRKEEKNINIYYIYVPLI